MSRDDSLVLMAHETKRNLLDSRIQRTNPKMFSMSLWIKTNLNIRPAWSNLHVHEGSPESWDAMNMCLT